MWLETGGMALGVVATSPEVDVEVEDITSLEVEAVGEEAAEAMEGLEVPVETLVGEEVNSARDREGTTAATGEATLREDLVEECPRERGWGREEAMLLLSEVGAGGKIKVIVGYFLIDQFIFY